MGIITDTKLDALLFQDSDTAKPQHEDNSSQKDVLIIVVSHKPYFMPEDDMYLPVAVGNNYHGESNWYRDSTGVNISDRNASFCELTAHYWAWKNLDAKHIGLAHYRRHFASRVLLCSKLRRIAEGKDIRKRLDHYDVILPRKRNYYLETNYSQYIHAHHAVDLDTTRAIIERLYPEYLQAWEQCMRRTSGHRFNMFVMKKDIFCFYSAWLFDILFELERRLDISGYSDYDKRVFGFVAERLLDVFITHNHIRYCEMPVVHLESQHWPKKIAGFIKRKIARSRNL